MSILNIFKKYTDFNQSCLGAELGSGVTGSVFEFENKAIKLCINYELPNQSIIDFLIENKDLNFVKVFSHKLYGPYKDNGFPYKDHGYESILSVIVMEKLLKISSDEEKVFHTILSHEDLNKKKNFSNSELKKILKELSIGLDFDEGKVIFFYEGLRNYIIYHSDIHQRNIMKDQLNNFKMVDCEFVKFKKRGLKCQK